MTTEYGFCVAEHVFKIDFADSRQDNIHLLPSFIPFIKEGENGGYVFYVKVSEVLCLNLPPLTDVHNYGSVEKYWGCFFCFMVFCIFAL